MDAVGGEIITLNKLNLIAAENIRIQENRIMSVENQLSVVFVYLVISKYIDDAYQCHGMNRGIKFVNHHCAFGQQSP